MPAAEIVNTQTRAIALPKVVSALQKARADYQPKLPVILRKGSFRVQADDKAALPPTDREAIKALFPRTYGKPVVRLVEGNEAPPAQALTVGVVLSGGPAPGGHNCIAGLFDALKAAHAESRLIGFLGGPKGVIEGRAQEITAEIVAAYRNTGGFDMIGSGRDKIESEVDLGKCVESLKQLGVDALVVIGGDDSNTNAAVLAEHMAAAGTGTRVIGLPKTIDGDMKNSVIESSFGFDTAAKTYSELVGNVCRDSVSAGKYWHFIKLMGRAASHVALEVALQTHPNLTIISEEARQRGTTLPQIVDEIVSVVCERAEQGLNYGVVIIPEGLLEFLPDFDALMRELGNVLTTEASGAASSQNAGDRVKLLSSKLSAASASVYQSLPAGIQETLLKRDKHGNIPVSQVETEKLLIDLVSARLTELVKSGKFTGKFHALGHFFGYEGRCVAPSNFDANYTYCLGYTAVQLVGAGLTGYTVFASNLAKPVDQWFLGGVPVTSMLNLEMRSGKSKPVIKKALVELEGAPFKAFAAQRESWVREDAFKYPGPIQYFGTAALTDSLTETVKLESSINSR